MEERNIAVVTGGAGFIGSHLCEMLVRAGRRVICIDDFSTGNVRNIEALLSNPNFQFLKLDITQPFDLVQMPELAPFKVQFFGVQEVYHLAAPTMVKNYEQYRMQALLTHSAGTRNVLDLALQSKAKVVIASSGVIYGDHDPAGPLVPEEERGVVDHLSPRAAFHEGKRFTETMAQTYALVHGLDCKIARIFRTYGPRMPLDQGHQIPDFVLNILDHQPVVVTGEKTTTTSLLYVADAVDGLMRLMAAEPGIGPVNFGSDVQVRFVDIVDQLIALAGEEAEVVFTSPPEHMVRMGNPSIAKAKERLGWLPLVRLEDGLRKLLDDIRANKMLVR